MLTMKLISDPIKIATLIGDGCVAELIFQEILAKV
jgi:hypothetical protein